jgi:hypothetical protein
MFVMLLLDPIDHSADIDPWPWGGESIYRLISINTLNCCNNN